MVQEGKEGQLGPEDFCRVLHAAGANGRLATEGWVRNQYCWVMWKLAAYERTYPHLLLGKLLTPEVVLDQLKYRSSCTRCPPDRHHPPLFLFSLSVLKVISLCCCLSLSCFSGFGDHMATVADSDTWPSVCPPALGKPDRIERKVLFTSQLGIVLAV